MNILQRLFGRTERRSAELVHIRESGRMVLRRPYGTDFRHPCGESRYRASLRWRHQFHHRQPAGCIYEVARGTDRVEVSGGPYAGLLGNPYAGLTWSDWIEFLMGSTLLHGNGLAEIVLDLAGNVTALRPLPWERVTPLRLLNRPELGRLVFNVTMPNEPVRQLLDSQVLLLRDRSDDGLLGRSRIGRSPGAVRNAEELQNFSLAGWENQATPTLAVALSKKLGDELFKRMRAQFDERYSGTRNAKKTIFLDEGSTVNPMSVSPEDAQILESRRFGVEELARIFQVPPPLVQDYTRNTFTNAATAGLLVRPVHVAAMGPQDRGRIQAFCIRTE